MCKCCEEIEFLKEQEKNKNSKFYSKIAIYGWRDGKRRIIKNAYFSYTSRVFELNYCPMCRKEAGRVIENYREIKFTEYVKHKGEPDWEIAWNKRMLELIDKDPTGGAKEKRLKNIRRWEEVKEKNAKRSD